MTKWIAICLAAVILSVGVCYSAEVEFGGLLQIKYLAEQHKDSDISTRTARLKGSVKLTDKIALMMTLEGAKEPNILDAQLDYTFAKYAVVRVGQFTLPFGFETSWSSFDIEAIDRSQLIDHLLNNGVSTPYLRDAGVMGMGRHKVFEYKVACVNGVGYNGGKDNNNYKDIVGRVGVGIPMFAGIGVSTYQGKWPEQWINKDKKVVKVIPQDRKAMGLDIYLDTGKLLFQMEYVRAQGLLKSHKEVVAPDTLDVAWSNDKYGGYYILLGYRVTPFLEPVFKYDRYDPNTDKKDDLLTDPNRNEKDDLLTDMYFGVNLNFEGKARLQVGYRMRDEATDKDNNQLLVQAGAKF
ncbi:MAG: porin [Candidatus Eisenbacteria bacterium]